MLTEAANEPFFNLVGRYVFAPYFAGSLATTQAEGASAWGLALGAAGFAVAVLAPALGSIADSGSRRMPWVVGTSLLGVLTCLSLWFAAPGVSLLPVMVAVFAATVALELLHVFTNAYLPGITTPGRVGLLSGVCFGVGQLAGIAALLSVLALSTSPPDFLADLPHAVDRMAGPLSALAILVFILPFLLLVPDAPGGGRTPSVAEGLRNLRRTLVAAWAVRDMRFFLVARMLGSDGLAVIFTFGAVLAGASFGWNAASFAVFGLVITVFGALGGFLGGVLDRRLGSKRLIILGFALVALGAASVILTDATRLVGIPTGVLLGEPLRSPQEIGFLVSGAIIATGAAFALGGMRALMAVLAPEGEATAYFGLFAFVGKATAFVGPFLVSAIALWTGSVRYGIVVALVFLAAGTWAMSQVRSPNARVA